MGYEHLFSRMTVKLKMIMKFIAHENSKCLSLLNLK